MRSPARRPPAVGQELIIPGLALAFTAYYFWTVDELAWEAKANGVVVGFILVALVALLLVRIGWKLAHGEASLRVALAGDPEADRQRLALLGLLVVFIVTLPWLGTSIALALLLFAAMWVLGARHLPGLIGVAIGAPLVVWLTLIVFLGTGFPEGPFERAMAALLGLEGR